MKKLQFILAAILFSTSLFALPPEELDVSMSKALIEGKLALLDTDGAVYKLTLSEGDKTKAMHVLNQGRPEIKRSADYREGDEIVTYVISTDYDYDKLTSQLVFKKQYLALS